MKNYYEILEVNKKASKEIIEKAYRVLVKKYHPDLYVGEKRNDVEQRMRDINEAYRILSDAFLREQYDTELEKEERSYQFDRNTQNTMSQKRKNTKNSVQEEAVRRHKVGTFMGLVDVTKELFRQRARNKQKKELKREDMIAAGLTLVIVIILGIILWCIPETKGFIRSLIPF
ncbi:MAG: J domain-containing protein [Clostridia bacterium]|nr:J domain-containing protein [Clostridia bacterium]